MGRSPNGRPTLVPLSSGRSLKTAAEALAALRLLGASPDGVTAETLAAELGKSASTARYLLNTLCQEGYATKAGSAGVHRLAVTPPWGGAWGAPEPVPGTDEPFEELPRAVGEVAAAATREWPRDAAHTSHTDHISSTEPRRR